MAVDGSTISLAASALSSVGEVMMSHTLDFLESGAAAGFGLFLYSIAAISALIIIAVGGHYKHGIYLLIGPGLFYFLISGRAPTEGNAWRFGPNLYDQNAVYHAVSDVTGGDGVPFLAPGITATAPASVPWFFAEYDRIVSNGVNAVVEVLLKLSPSNTNLTFADKVDRYVELFNLQIQDPMLKFFTNVGAVNKCSRYFSLLQYQNSPSYVQSTDDNTRAEIAERINRLSREQVMNMDEYPQLQRWGREVGITFPSRMMTCNDLWTTSLRALRREAEGLTMHVAGYGVPELGVKGPQELVGHGRFANFYKLADKFASDHSAGDDTIARDEHLSNQAVQYMINEVTARMLMKELSKRNPSLAALEYARNPETRSDVDEAEADESIRQISNKEEWEGKGDFITGALSLPYVQGMVLFFLAMFYPFFAMALILPGRHTVFLQWLGLWLWVKSWDIGFTVVMLVDEILYELMPHGPPINDAMMTDPAAILKALSATVEPSYHANMYYVLIASLMTSVPLLTAIFVGRAGGELVETIQSGAQGFATKVGSAMTAVQGASQTQSHIARANRNMRAAVPGLLNRAMEDPEVQFGIAMGKFGYPAAVQAMKGKGGTLGSVANSFVGKTAEQAMEIAKAKINYLYADGMRKVSLKEDNMHEYRMATLNGWYSHDVVQAVPSNAYLSLMKARHTVKFGGVLDQIFNKGFSGVYQMALDRFSKRQILGERGIGDLTPDQIDRVDAQRDRAIDILMGNAPLLAYATGRIFAEDEPEQGPRGARPIYDYRVGEDTHFDFPPSNAPRPTADPVRVSDAGRIAPELYPTSFAARDMAPEEDGRLSDSDEAIGVALSGDLPPPADMGIAMNPLPSSYRLPQEDEEEEEEEVVVSRSRDRRPPQKRRREQNWAFLPPGGVRGGTSGGPENNG